MFQERDRSGQEKLPGLNGRGVAVYQANDLLSSYLRNILRGRVEKCVTEQTKKVYKMNGSLKGALCTDSYRWVYILCLETFLGLFSTSLGITAFSAFLTRLFKTHNDSKAKVADRWYFFYSIINVNFGVLKSLFR